MQKRATRMIPGFAKFSYDQRLKALNLQTLEKRRHRGDLIETFKFLRGFYTAGNKLFELNSNSNTRGHSYKVQCHYSKLDIRKHFFTNRVAEEWNKLPDSVVASESVNMFKNNLDRYWLERNQWHGLDET